jgi:single-stranded-DNA-specific exonuclease
LKKLIEASGISGKKIESYHIGFILAPRINASGRMSSAKKAVRLMLTEDEAEAEELASELEELNALRKKTEQEIFVQAVSKIDGDSLHKKNVIVVYGTDWHEGVLGIVASKLTEKFEKPAVVISLKDGMGRGSARSLDYLDIYEALKHVDGYLVKYGGHKLAAGLSICMKDINQFTSELNRYAGTAAGSSGEFKELQVDALIGCQDITNRLYEEINMFEPYGHGNTKPVFAVKNASLCNIKKVGKEGNHISFHLYDSAKDVPVIGFDKISILEKVLTRPRSYIVSINNNEFKGANNLQLILQNVEETDEFDYTIDENKSKILNSLINKSKSKIIKTDLFKLVEKINTAYNTKTTAEEILCMLKKKGDIQYVLKDDILYIKR